jgi:ribokinase
LGGNAVYAAAAARLWGVRAGVVSRINEQIPWAALDPVARAGVDLGGVRAIPGATGLRTFVQYRADGSRVGMTGEEFREQTGARFAPQADDDLRPHIARYEDLHIDVSPVPTQMPLSWRTAACHLVMTMPWVSQSAFVSCLAGQRPCILLDPYAPYMAEASDAQLHDVLAHVRAILPSEDELRRRYPVGDLVDAARRLLALGSPQVVLKLGARGSVVVRPDSIPVVVPAYPTTEKDPTGAGDSFLGGLAAGLLETGDLVQAALWGTVSASFTVEDFGLTRLLAANRSEALLRLDALQQGMS